MERLRQEVDFLKLIPPATLKKLKPFENKLNLVMRESADFSHLKYHVLDELSLLRHCDQEIKTFRDQVNKGISHGWIEDEDLYEHPWMRNMPNGIVEDMPTYDRIERGIRLHDIGRKLQEIAKIDPTEHHFASVFVATHVDGDPVVCAAVLNHIMDVLPSNASIVERHVRDIDRMAGSGYIGLIRALYYQGFTHPIFEEKDEDKIINEEIMVTFSGTDNIGNESTARDFFWKEVYPFYKAKGVAGVMQIGNLSKLILDRIFGRDYTGRKLDLYESRVLKIDNGVKVVEPVQDVYQTHLSFKIKNTLEVLAETRYVDRKDSGMLFKYLTREERKIYKI